MSEMGQEATLGSSSNQERWGNRDVYERGRAGGGSYPGVRLMQTITRSLIIAVAASIVLTSEALAAGTTSNVRGTIEQVSGDTMQVKESNGTSVNVRLAQSAKIATVAKASL